MPHTSKKYRKQNAASKGPNRTILFIVVAVIAIIAVAGGYYVYSSALHTTSSTTTTNSTATQSSSSSGASTTNTVSGQSGLIYAKLDTSQGVIEVELFQSLTPKTVANFVSLANSGFYNNLVWHRIVKGFVIQTGDPTTKNGAGNPCNWGSGSSNTTIPFEYVPSLPNNVGYLGMASTGAGQPGTSQFYINLANNTSLNGNYAVFGKVISGMNVVNALGNLPTSSSCSNGSTPPADPADAMLISVTIQSSP
jgi:cyclophilin family peptidyl-prolyl cis-trans isomerase